MFARHVLIMSSDTAWITPAVAKAHEILRAVPGAAFDGEPFMVQAVGQHRNEQFAACNCYYHTVMFANDCALIFTNDEGGMVPWLECGESCFPDPNYFVAAVKLDAGEAESFLQQMLAQIDVPQEEFDAPGV